MSSLWCGRGALRSGVFHAGDCRGQAGLPTRTCVGVHLVPLDVLVDHFLSHHQALLGRLHVTRFNSVEGFFDPSPHFGLLAAVVLAADGTFLQSALRRRSIWHLFWVYPDNRVEHST